VRPVPVAVVVPQYRPELTADEAICVRSVERHLGGYDRFVIAPEGLERTLPGYEVVRFPERFFTSAKAFARLQLRARLYRAFAAYEHILMVQLDALVLSDRLSEFCAGAYDYIGAPWLERDAVGNGGFSLRRVPAFLRVLESRRYALGGPDRNWHAVGPRWPPGTARYRRGENSDGFWSFDAPRRHRGFRVASVEEALRFSWEVEPRRCFELARGQLPFGAHAWALYDRAFWEPYLLD
jgi:hypothetical protein